MGLADLWGLYANGTVRKNIRRGRKNSRGTKRTVPRKQSQSENSHPIRGMPLTGFPGNDTMADPMETERTVPEFFAIG